MLPMLQDYVHVVGIRYRGRMDALLICEQNTTDRCTCSLGHTHGLPYPALHAVHAMGCDQNRFHDIRIGP